MTTRGRAPWTAVVLSGGDGRRLGGVAKSRLLLGQRTLLDRILDDLPATVHVIVAGPACPTVRPVSFVQEDPPAGGPVAGIAAAVQQAQTDIVAVIAADMPWGGRALPRLVDALASGTAPAVIAVDASGRQQPLCAAWRRSSLVLAVDRLAGGRDRPARALLQDVPIAEVAIDDRLLVDIDTADDLSRARTLIDMGDEVVMQEWIAAVQAKLGLDADVDVPALLDVARVAAHNVARPAAPVTTYLLGLAVGQGADATAAAAAIDELAGGWLTTGQA